jgi:hypothetical protein
MSNLYDEIISLIDDKFGDLDEDSPEFEILEDYAGSIYEVLMDGDYERIVTDYLLENGVSTKLVDEHGGKGQGDEFWAVYEFTKGTDSVFIQFDGFYASHIGSEYQECFPVKPKVIEQTIYERT